jgi:hypothetical protein
MTGFANHPNSANLASQVAGDPIEIERKLRRLIGQCEYTLRELRRNRPNIDWCHEKLRAAIEDARKP